MEVYVLIFALIVLGAVCFAYGIGYRRGVNAKKLVIESLSFKQAMKLWQIHELIRHEDDKKSIRRDLRKLANVEMPKGVDYTAWFDVK